MSGVLAVIKHRPGLSSDTVIHEVWVLFCA